MMDIRGMVVQSSDEEDLRDLRLYRELRARRDLLIHRAAKAKRTQREIGSAAGLSVDRISQIMGGR